MSRLAVAPGQSLAQAQRRLTQGVVPSPLINTVALITGSNRNNPTATAGTAHVKGAWVELAASTEADSDFLWIRIRAATNTAATDTSSLLDIGIGALTAEQVIVPDLLVGYNTTTIELAVYLIPVRIPRGSRVAARCQSAVASKTILPHIAYGNAGGYRSPSKIIAMGVNTATSKGVTLTAPGSADTKGAWTEIIASTTQPFDALNLGVQGNSDTDMVAANTMFDIGIGSAGNERVIVPDMMYVSRTDEGMEPRITPTYMPVRLPAGVRLAVRYQSQETTNTYDAALYGTVPT